MITKEQFAQEIKDIKAKEQELSNRRRELKATYLQENKAFDVGDKVEIEVDHWNRGVSKEIAFVRAINTHDSGEIYYGFQKVKKDGTASPHKHHLWDSPKSITLIEKAKS